MEITENFDGWNLLATLPSDIKENAKSIKPFYSFDGINFIYDDFCELDFVNDGYMMPPICEPLKSFLAGTVEQFWVRVEIESENPFYTGLSTVASITKTPEIITPPENTELKIYTGIPNTLREGNGTNINFCYNVTISKLYNKTKLLHTLPTTIPIDIQVEYQGEIVAKQFVDYKVDWNLPDNLPQTDFIHNNVTLIPPDEDITISSPTIDYNCGKLPPVTVPTGIDQSKPTPFNLIVTVISPGKKAVPMLSLIDDEIPYFSMTPKPTGASEIIPEYSLDGGITWQSNDIISTLNTIDKIPKQNTYSTSLFSDLEKPPMYEYLTGKIKGFLVRLQIHGGVFDGVSEVVNWPPEYEYIPPPNVNDDNNGAGGNRGNVGSGNNENNGVRPKPDLSEPIHITIESQPMLAMETHRPITSEKSIVILGTVSGQMINSIENLHKFVNHFLNLLE